MSRDFITDILIFLLLFAGSWVVQSNAENEPLSDETVTVVSLMNLPVNGAFVQKISLAPTSNIIFNITDTPSNISFITFQVHTYQYNVTLSYDKTALNKVSNTSIFGSNIGLFIDTTLKKSTQMFLKNDNVRIVNAMLVVVGYDNKAPIPGGCNMEFNTEVAPYEKIRMRDSVVIVEFQSASVSPHNALHSTCEKNPVQHEMYRMYLPEQDFSLETYFSAMSKMLTVKDIIKNGEKVLSPVMSSSMRRIFGAYPGVGSVYVAIATSGNDTSAYVPTFSYACNPLLYPETCDMLKDSFSKTLCAITFFLGFFSVFVGHRHLKADMSLPIFFVATIIAYIVTANTNSEGPESNANIQIAITVGAVATLSWMLLHSYSALFSCSGLIFNLTPGFFFASVMYFCAPDSFIILGNDWVFWILFATVILSVSLVMGVLNSVAVITCAMFGAYMMIVPIDYYAGSSLKYVVVNVIRRGIIPDFGIATVQAPYQATDICLTILWVCLIILRTLKQCCPTMLALPDMHSITERTPLITSRFIGRVNVRT